MNIRRRSLAVFVGGDGGGVSVVGVVAVDVAVLDDARVSSRSMSQ